MTNSNSKCPTLAAWTFEQMDRLLAVCGSIAQCSREVKCDPKTWKRYYAMKKIAEHATPLAEVASKTIITKKNATKSASADVFFDKDEMNVGVFDIESTGLTGDFSCMLCAVIKPYGRDDVRVFKIDLDKRDMLEAEKDMLLEFLPVLESFDGLAGYYSTRFDMPLIRTRCMFHGIPAPKKMKHFDAYFTIRRTVNPTTRRMDRIAEINRLTDKSLPEKSKLGVEEWTGATFRRDSQALDYIADHCVKDVMVLESIIDKYMDFMPERIMRS